MIDQHTRREKNQFTPEQDAILAKMEARLAAGMTVTRLHVATGIAERTIERLVTRNRGYSRMDDHETESAFADLAEWLASEDEAARALAETPTYQRIYQLITYAHKSRQMVAITGDVGIGKTEAAKAYATAHPMTNGQPGALYVRFSEGESRATAALEKVRQTMRGARATVMGGKPMTAIEDAVRPGDCIILDECNFLGDAIDIARCLHDDLDIPVVLIGKPLGFREIERAIGDQNTESGRAQFASYAMNRFDDGALYFFFGDLVKAGLRRIMDEMTPADFGYGAIHPDKVGTGLAERRLAIDETRKSLDGLLARRADVVAKLLGLGHHIAPTIKH